MGINTGDIITYTKPGQTLPTYQKIGRQYRFPVKNVAEFIENSGEFQEKVAL